MAAVMPGGSLSPGFAPGGGAPSPAWRRAAQVGGGADESPLGSGSAGRSESPAPPTDVDTTTVEVVWNARGLTACQELSRYTAVVAATLSFNRLASLELGGTLQRLRRLDVSHNELSGSLPPLAAAAPALEMLDVSYNALHDVRAVAGCRALRELRAHQNAVQSLRETVAALSDAPALQVATLHDNPCTTRLATADLRARAVVAAAAAAAAARAERRGSGGGGGAASRRSSLKDRMRAAVSEAAAGGEAASGDRPASADATTPSAVAASTGTGATADAAAPATAPLPLEAAAMYVIHHCDGLKTLVLASPMRMVGLADPVPPAAAAHTPITAASSRATTHSTANAVADGGAGLGAEFTGATMAACVVVVTPALADAAHAWARSIAAPAFDAILGDIDGELGVSSALSPPPSHPPAAAASPAATSTRGRHRVTMQQRIARTGDRRHPTDGARAPAGRARPVAAEGSRVGVLASGGGGGGGGGGGDSGTGVPSRHGLLSRISEERDSSTRGSGRSPRRRVSGVVSGQVGGSPPVGDTVPGEIDAMAAAECDAGYRVTYSGRVLEGASGGGVLSETDGGVALRVRPDGTATCKWPCGLPALDVSADLRAGSALRRYADLMDRAGGDDEEEGGDGGRRDAAAAAVAAAFRLVGYAREGAGLRAWRSIDVDGFGVGAVTDVSGATVLRFRDDGSGFHTDGNGMVQRRWNALGEISYVAPGFTLWEPVAGSTPARPAGGAAGGAAAAAATPTAASPHASPRRRHSLPAPLAPPVGVALPPLPVAGGGGGGGGGAAAVAAAPARSPPPAAARGWPHRWERVSHTSPRAWCSPRRRPPASRSAPALEVLADLDALRLSVLGDMFADAGGATEARMARLRNSVYLATPQAAAYLLGNHMAVSYNLWTHELKLYLACKAFRYELVVSSSTGGASNSAQPSPPASPHVPTPPPSSSSTSTPVRTPLLAPAAAAHTGGAAHRERVPAAPLPPPAAAAAGRKVSPRAAVAASSVKQPARAPPRPSPKPSPTSRSPAAAAKGGGASSGAGAAAGGSKRPAKAGHGARKHAPSVPARRAAPAAAGAASSAAPQPAPITQPWTRVSPEPPAEGEAVLVDATDASPPPAADAPTSPALSSVVFDMGDREPADSDDGGGGGGDGGVRVGGGADSVASFTGLGDASEAEEAVEEAHDSAGMSPTPSTADPFPISLGPVRSGSELAAEVGSLPTDDEGSGGEEGAARRAVVTPVMTLRAASFRRTASSEFTPARESAAAAAAAAAAEPASGAPVADPVVTAALASEGAITEL